MRDVSSTEVVHDFRVCGSLTGMQSENSDVLGVRRRRGNELAGGTATGRVTSNAVVAQKSMVARSSLASNPGSVFPSPNPEGSHLGIREELDPDGSFRIRAVSVPWILIDEPSGGGGRQERGNSAGGSFGLPHGCMRWIPGP